MHLFLTVLVVLALLATVGVLALGIRSMIIGGDPRRSNKLMQARVMFQFLALMLMGLIMLMYAHH